MAKSSVFFNAHWQIWPKNCSKTQKFRKFEPNLAQNSQIWKFSQKSGKIKRFFQCTLADLTQKLFKNPKIRKFEQNLGQICQCANENSKNWTFFSLAFRNANENLGFTKKKQKLIRLGFFQEFLNKKWSKFRKLDLIWHSFLPR